MSEACGGLWRSEDVLRMDAYVPRESLRDSILQLGLLGKVQVIDLQDASPQFSRPHATEVRQCDEALRKLAAIETHLEKAPASCAAFRDDVNFCAPLAEVMTETSSSAGALDDAVDAVEATLADLEALDTSIEGICREMNAAAEVRLLRESLVSSVHRAHQWGRRSESPVRDEHGSPASPTTAVADLASLPNVVGTVAAARADAVSGLALRVTRGHAVITVDVVQNEHFALPDWGQAECAAPLCVFSVFSVSVVAISRLRKLLLGLGATVHNVEDVLAHAESDSPSGALTSSAVNWLPTLSALHRQREVKLRHWYPHHRRLKTRLHVEKRVSATMGMCTFSGAMCVCALWVPVRHEQEARAALEVAADVSGSLARPILARSNATPSGLPPTYFMTNRFTACFQGIVDSYGPAHYKEINPGVFTIITFPYLFGIMYGDIGHGTLLLCLAVFLIYKERSWEGAALNEMLAMIYSGRYVLLLMSLFAIYLGFLYNDFFGFSINAVASGYVWPPLPNASSRNMDGYSDHVTPQQPDGRPSVRPSHACAFGMDAAWAETENKLEYYNSVKMKSAVIVGIAHMLSGLCLAMLNALRTHDYRRLWFLVVPEMVFLMSTFGYMTWLIILKWCTRWANTHDAPSILETMTNFFLQPGVVPHPLFAGQAGFQVCLLLLAVAMVPLMLLGMPVTEYRAHKRWLARQRERRDTAEAGLHTDAFLGHQRHDNGAADSADAGDAGIRVLADDDDAATDAWRVGEEASQDAQFAHFDLSELAIHYTIHTIEYVLGSVSNTASYLRLWALSLAHAQLSEVFFNFAVVAPLSVDTTGLAIGLGVVVWLAATVGVLVGMEALSAFLHALRLHWVEFQSKFYVGDGHLFAPLSFES